MLLVLMLEHLFISILSTAQPSFQQRSTLLSQNCLVSISKRSCSLVTLFQFAWFFFVFFKDLLSGAFAVLRFRGLHFLLSPLLHQFSQPPPFFHTQVYICVHGLSISVMDLNTFPPSLHPRFLFLFLSSFSHVGLLLSCPPYCQSAFTHPAFISISPEGDLGRTHLLSLLQVHMSKFIRFPLVTVSFTHSIAFYLPIHPFAYSPGSYYFYFALKLSDYSFFPAPQSSFQLSILYSLCHTSSSTPYNTLTA